MSARRFWKPLSASLRSASKSNYLVQGKTVYNPVAQVFTILLLTGDVAPYKILRAFFAYHTRQHRLPVLCAYRQKVNPRGIVIKPNTSRWFSFR